MLNAFLILLWSSNTVLEAPSTYLSFLSTSSASRSRIAPHRISATSLLRNLKLSIVPLWKTRSSGDAVSPLLHLVTIPCTVFRISTSVFFDPHLNLIMGHISQAIPISLKSKNFLLLCLSRSILAFLPSFHSSSHPFPALPTIQNTSRSSTRWYRAWNFNVFIRVSQCLSNCSSFISLNCLMQSPN